MIDKKIKLFAFTDTPSDGKSFVIEVVEKAYFDPIDFYKDTSEVIYKKLVNNHGHFIRLRNEAIAKGSTIEPIYITNFIISKSYDSKTKDFSSILQKEVTYKGNSIEIIANRLNGEKIKKIRQPAPQSTLGTKKRHELWLLGEGRNKIKNHDNTYFEPRILRVVIRNKEFFNQFIKDVNDASQ